MVNNTFPENLREKGVKFHMHGAFFVNHDCNMALFMY